MQRERAERIQSCGTSPFSFADSTEGFFFSLLVRSKGWFLELWEDMVVEREWNEGAKRGCGGLHAYIR
jgi:hypothetical protein